MTRSRKALDETVPKPPLSAMSLLSTRALDNRPKGVWVPMQTYAYFLWPVTFSLSTRFGGPRGILLLEVLLNRSGSGWLRSSCRDVSYLPSTPRKKKGQGRGACGPGPVCEPGLLGLAHCVSVKIGNAACLEQPCWSNKRSSYQGVYVVMMRDGA